MQKEDVVPSDIFPHVYSFLVRFGFLKSAKLFRKEANMPRVVVDTPGLLDFYEAFKNRKKKVVDALQTEEVVASKKKKRKLEKQLNKKPLKKKKSSSSESSSEEEQQIPVTVEHKPTSIKKHKQVITIDKEPAEEEGSSSSSSDNETAKSNGIQGGAGEVASSVLPKHRKIAVAVTKSASSSSEDSSSEDDDNAVKTAPSIAKQSQEDDQDSSSSSSDIPTTKPFSPIVKPHTIPKAKKLKNKPTSSQPFCRVDKKTPVDFKLADNSFEAKSGARGSWGEKAHHVLKNTKGRSFRHEKTKKKRGSYTGGRIDTAVHSIKFDNSD